MFDKFYLCESKIIMALFYVRLTVRFAVRGYLRLTLYKYVCVLLKILQLYNVRLTVSMNVRLTVSMTVRLTKSYSNFATAEP